MASVGELTATLRANTAQFTAPMQDAVAQLRALGIEAGKATGAERALAIAQQQTIIQGLKKQGLVIINGQLVASETAAAEAAERTTAAYGGGAVGIGRIERSLASLISRSIGLPTQFGSIGASLARMSAGILGSLGIIAAIGLLTYAFSTLIDKMREASKAAEESRTRIQKAFDAETLKQQFDDANQAAQDLTDATNKLADARDHFSRAQGPRISATPFTQDFFKNPPAVTTLTDAEKNDPVIAALQQAVITAQNRYDEAQKLLKKAQNDRDKVLLKPPPDAPTVPFQYGPTKYLEVQAQQAFDAQQQAIQDAFEKLQKTFEQQDAFFRKQGETLSHSLVEGIVNGNLSTTLFNGLKSIFISVLEKLLDDAVIKGLVKQLEQMLGIVAPTTPAGPDIGGLLGGVGNTLINIATGGLFGLGTSAQAAHGASTLARSGSGGTLIVNASGSMPAPLGPVEHARDAQWLAVFAETARVAPSLGIRMGVT